VSDAIRRLPPPGDDDPVAALIRQFIDPSGPARPFAGTPFHYAVPSAAPAFDPAEWNAKREALKELYEPRMATIRERVRTLQDARESARGILAGSTRRDLDVKIATSSRELADTSLDYARAQAAIQVEEERARKTAQENREEVRQAYNDWIQHPQRVAEGIAAVSTSYVEAARAADEARRLKATAKEREAADLEEALSRRAVASAARARAEQESERIDQERRVFAQSHEYATTLATKVVADVLKGDRASSDLHVACGRFVTACKGAFPRKELERRLVDFATQLLEEGMVGPGSQSGGYTSGIR